MKEERFDLPSGRYPIKCKRFSPDGPSSGVVLGVHGFAGDKESSMLSPLASRCAEKGVSLLCFDFPSHGESEAGSENLTVANCMDDLRTAADRCRSDYPGGKKYLFATSFGGYIALLCARDLADFQFVLRAPAVSMPDILLCLLGTTPKKFREAGSAVCGFSRKITVPYRFYEELQRNRLSAAVPDYPMLIVHGDRDDVVPFEDVSAFCSSRKNAVLVPFPGTDHHYKREGEKERVARIALDRWGL